MEQSTGTTLGTGRLRALNQPRPVAIATDDQGVPLSIRGKAVAAIAETWRIDEGWWREDPVSRRYWRLLLEKGEQAIVYQDLETEAWYEQRP